MLYTAEDSVHTWYLYRLHCCVVYTALPPTLFLRQQQQWHVGRSFSFADTAVVLLNTYYVTCDGDAVPDRVLCVLCVCVAIYTDLCGGKNQTGLVTQEGPFFVCLFGGKGKR